MKSCANPDCTVETSNSKFCSRSCSAIIGNRMRPKRTRKTRYCKHCGVQVVNRVTTCDPCNPQKKDWSTVRIKDLHQISNRIRQLARRWYTGPRECFICGYSTHVQICHIKPIKEFDRDALVTEVNSQDNLVALCPNHHWEIDNAHYPLCLLNSRKGRRTQVGSNPT